MSDALDNKKAEMVFSLDGERYYDDADYIEGEIDDETQTIYVGQKEVKTHSLYISIDNLIEEMKDSAYQDADEFAEDYLNDIKEHKENIEKLILEYMDKNVSQPTFWSVKGVKEISVAEFKALYC